MIVFDGILKGRGNMDLAHHTIESARPVFSR